MLLGHPPHADRPSDARQPGLVRREERAPVDGGAPAPPGVVLPVAADDALVLPGLEELAALVSETALARHQHPEVLRHLGRHRRLHLDDDPAQPLALHGDVEEVARVAGGRERDQGHRPGRRRRG